VERRWDFSQEGMLWRKRTSTSWVVFVVGDAVKGGVMVSWDRWSLVASAWRVVAYSMFSVLRGSWPPAMTSRAEDVFLICSGIEAYDSSANSIFFFLSNRLIERIILRDLQSA